MILRKRGSSVGNKVMPNEVLYHIGISAEMLKGAEYALLPGDPGRVEALARALGTAEPVGCHREYTSWLADVEGTSVLVCSTGMGGPSVAIGMEELARLGIKNFIRVGTTGSIQKDVELGDFEIPHLHSAVGNEFDGEPDMPIRKPFRILTDKPKNPYEFQYMMLSRLQSDCEYYLNYGNRCTGHLYYHNESKQIAAMKKLWNEFPDDGKPEWLTWKQILEYEKAMCSDTK